ncbi:hypothetical protein WJX72_001757 [[Myrmecia] bisecta]|uniref:Uncharacterized protein n=1 Tax=[Myrmecia] bisecta TaxID=41462 RepID=A0AAW1R557_9CHLO
MALPANKASRKDLNNGVWLTGSRTYLTKSDCSRTSQIRRHRDLLRTPTSVCLTALVTKGLEFTRVKVRTAVRFQC